MQPTLMPSFVKDFKCTGKLCKLNCCFAWDVPVDKKSYKKFITIKDRELKNRIVKGMKRNQRNSDPYAILEYDRDIRRCIFLEEDHLCEIERKQGPEFLCTACAQFPRFYNVAGKHPELTLMAGCPEAVRLGLLPEDPMQFEFSDYTSLAPTTENHFRKPADAQNYATFRETGIDILQDRRFSFENRLILLGMFIQRLAASVTAESISAFRSLLDTPSIADQFSSFPSLPDMKYEVISVLVGRRLKAAELYGYNQLMEKTIQGIEAWPELTQQERVENYLAAEKKYAQVSPSWDHVFENYFVNVFFAKALDVFSTGSCWEFFVSLGIAYLILKFHFTGHYNLNKTFSTDDLVYLLTVVDRTFFTHSKVLINRMSAWLKEKKMDSLAHIAAIITT